jgi:hypothetical protein
MNNPSKDTWGISGDGENFYGTLPSPEVAIHEGQALYPDEPFWIGRFIDADPPEALWDGETWLDDLLTHQHYNHALGQDWADNIPTPALEELQIEIRSVIARWIDRHNLQPDFEVVEDCQEIKPQKKL